MKCLLNFINHLEIELEFKVKIEELTEFFVNDDELIENKLYVVRGFIKHIIQTRENYTERLTSIKELTKSSSLLIKYIK